MSSQHMRLDTLHHTIHHSAIIDIPHTARDYSIDALNRLLVETIDVALCARHAQWNVRGANFTALHYMFARVANELNEQSALLAERIGVLGGQSHGTVQQVASKTTLKPYPIHHISSKAHIEAIAARLGMLSAELRLTIEESRYQTTPDPVTVHVFTRINSTIDRLLWTVESHLMEPR
jgi:starvation-inducible DNA-binding protein